MSHTCRILDLLKWPWILKLTLNYEVYHFGQFMSLFYNKAVRCNSKGFKIRGGEINCPCCPCCPFVALDKLLFPVDLSVDKLKHPISMCLFPNDISRNGKFTNLSLFYFRNLDRIIGFTKCQTWKLQLNHNFVY